MYRVCFTLFIMTTINHQFVFLTIALYLIFLSCLYKTMDLSFVKQKCIYSILSFAFAFFFRVGQRQKTRRLLGLFFTWQIYLFFSSFSCLLLLLLLLLLIPSSHFLFLFVALCEKELITKNVFFFGFFVILFSLFFWSVMIIRRFISIANDNK